ncbi:tethering factor for nuclear proteasome sts1 [Myriangium duriaei CBS 260.36]|uniref:Tethering factor for nuclear proteasome STS1 n=1 Tax=Myriangium duriaei CBS 260.36 TaxID=1168546 RepID=A0A9P4J913_9PEZI|nr:tethering factor for nuclear proteasome sts1 [Myriangium duriaei CBS 260.36]
MNSVIPTHTLFAPHLLENPRHSSPRADLYTTSNMAGRKRKADSADPEDRMSTSPTASPSTSSRTLPAPLQPRTKRHRNLSATGRPLGLPRLLETLSPADLRTLLTQVCTQHPSIAQEISAIAPRPTLESTLSVLQKYESAFKEAFPFGSRPGSEYAYNRVRSALSNLLDALKDFTPHFLPPNESQTSVGLAYLDAVTNIVHRLPDWDNAAHNRSKDEAYEELSGAWSTVLKEAEKRGGGFQLQFGGWDQKLARHNEHSHGRLQPALDELQRGLGWFGGPGRPTNAPPGMDDRLAVRQQLLSGTYGPQVGVGGGGQW